MTRTALTDVVTGSYAITTDILTSIILLTLTLGGITPTTRSLSTILSGADCREVVGSGFESVIEWMIMIR